MSARHHRKRDPNQAWSWVPSQGLSLVLSAPVGGPALEEQATDYGVPLDDLLMGERYAGEEIDGVWTSFVVRSFEPEARLTCLRRRR